MLREISPGCVEFITCVFSGNTDGGRAVSACYILVGSCSACPHVIHFPFWNFQWCPSASTMSTKTL